MKTDRAASLWRLATTVSATAYGLLLGWGSGDLAGSMAGVLGVVTVVLFLVGGRRMVSIPVNSALLSEPDQKIWKRNRAVSRALMIVVLIAAALLLAGQYIHDRDPGNRAMIRAAVLLFFGVFVAGYYLRRFDTALKARSGQ